MLSDKKILEEIKKEEIIISPFKREHLGSNSYDLTISHIIGRHTVDHERTVEVWDPECIQQAEINSWEEEECCLVIPLAPFETVRCLTNEVLGCREKTVGIMSVRSKVTRLPLIFSYSTLLDTGFKGRISFVIFNNSKNKIVLRTGMRVMQIMFFYVDGDIEQKYNEREWSLNTDMDSWKLPRYKVDKEFLVSNDGWSNCPRSMAEKQKVR